jgi:hypothetical protein
MLTGAEKFVRGVNRAVAQNVQLFATAQGQAFAASVSNEGTLYAVDVHSCECLGFQNHGQCKHNSAFVIGLALTIID